MSEEVTLDEFADSSDTEDSQERATSRFWGEIPEGWRLVNGSEVYDVNPNPKPEEEPNTYIEMDALDTELPWPKYFGTRDASEYSGKTFTKGDTLFARITPCTENGKAALVPEMETEVGIGSTEYAVLSPKRGSINPWLLYYFGKSHPVHNYAVSRMRGSTGRQRVPFSVFRRELDVALPPLPEQRKIATILYTVDRAIEKTGEIIDKFESIRSGLIEDIATTGIGNENLVEQKVPMLPERWEIPAHWELKFLKDISTLITDGAHQTPTYVDNGIPFLKVEDIKQDEIDWDSVARIPEEEHKTLTNRGKPTEGDVLLSKNGTIGISKVVDWNREFSHFVSLALIRPNQEIILSEYLSTLLESRICMRQANARSKTGTVTNLHLEEIEQLSIPVPPIPEQREILKKVSAVEDGLSTEKEYLNRLKRFKRGLMQDLLSGTVRTTDTNIEVPEEIAQYG
ncbi:restriction endonuclease subunit S [Natronomonas amylolytica]|uniref:restriction endonuclease subunit S n=1 Tax=Natronomonas amylolytica TaxID=3108498 RepID=UPI00300A31E9